MRYRGLLMLILLMTGVVAAAQSTTDDSAYAVISPENAAETELVGVLGRGVTSQVTYLNNNTVATLSDAGIWTYNTHDITASPRWRALRVPGETLAQRTQNENIIHEMFPISARFDLGAILAGSGSLYEATYWSSTPNGNLLVFNQPEQCDTETDVCTQRIVVWDIPTDRSRMSVIVPPALGFSLAMRDTQLAVRYADRTDFYTLETGTLSFSLPASLRGFSPDGYAAVSLERREDSTTAALEVWELGLREQIMRLTFAPDEWVHDVVFSDDGARLAVTVAEVDVEQRRLRPRALDIWNVRTGQLTMTQDILGLSQHATFSPDGQYALLSGSYHWELLTVPIELYDLESGALLWSMPDESWRSAIDVAFREDSGEVVILYPEGRLQLIDVLTGELLGETPGYGGYAESIAFREGEALVSDGDDVRVWDLATLNHVETYSDCELLAYHEASDTALCRLNSFDGVVFFETLTTGEQLATVDVFDDGYVVAAAFHPNGESVAVTMGNGAVYQVDVASGEQSRIVAGRDVYNPFGLQYSADGRYLAAGAAGTVFDTQTWETVAQPDVDTAQMNHTNLVFSEAGDWYALPAIDSNLYVWRWSDLLDGASATADTALASVPLDHPEYSRVAASADGRLLAVTGEAVVLYETETFTEVGRVQDSGNLLQFSPDGRQLIVGDGYCYVCGVDESYQVGTARIYGVKLLD